MKKANISSSDAKFLASIRSQTNGYLSLLKVCKNKKERKEAAQKIIETIPARLKNYTVHGNIDKYNETRIILYGDFKQELKNPNNRDFPYDGSKEYRRFKYGTIGYYLGKYLYLLNFKYSTWMGTLQIELPASG